MDGANERQPASLLLLFLGASRLLGQMLAALPNVTPRLDGTRAKALRGNMDKFLAFDGRGAGAPITLTKTTGAL